MYDQFVRNRNRNRHKHHLQPFYSKPRLAKTSDKIGESRKMSEKYLFKTRKDGGSMLQLRSDCQIVSCSCWISGEETRAEGAHGKRNENEKWNWIVEGFLFQTYPLRLVKPGEDTTRADIWVTPPGPFQTNGYLSNTSGSWRRHAENQRITKKTRGEPADHEEDTRRNTVGWIDDEMNSGFQKNFREKRLTT